MVNAFTPPTVINTFEFLGYLKLIITFTKVN
jgi:hypothetical protein